MNMQEKLEKLYVTLQGANIDEFIDKKDTGKKVLDYLSWGAAVDFFTKACHELHLDWTYSHELIEYPQGAGFGVKTTITIIDGESPEKETTLRPLSITKHMTLHCMTASNQAAKGANFDAVVINKTQMRCLVKCMTLFGLGLKLYLKNFDELDEVKTGKQVVQDRVQKFKDRIKELLDSVDPAVDTSAFARYETIDDIKQLEVMGKALKKIVDTQGAGDANN
jgi:hypothetical protein